MYHFTLSHINRPKSFILKINLLIFSKIMLTLLLPCSLFLTRLSAVKERRTDPRFTKKNPLGHPFL